MFAQMTANSNATAVAAGFMVAKLANALVEKGLLSRDEVASVFKEASDQLRGHYPSPLQNHGPEVVEAVIAQLPDRS